jgi:hypothetical protein
VAGRAHATYRARHARALRQVVSASADGHDRPAFSAPQDASFSPPPVQVVRPSIAAPATAAAGRRGNRGAAPPGPPSAPTRQNRQGRADDGGAAGLAQQPTGHRGEGPVGRRGEAGPEGGKQGSERGRYGRGGHRRPLLARVRPPMLPSYANAIKPPIRRWTTTPSPRLNHRSITQEMRQSRYHARLHDSFTGRTWSW